MVALWQKLEAAYMQNFVYLLIQVLYHRFPLANDAYLFSFLIFNDIRILPIIGISNDSNDISNLVQLENDFFFVDNHIVGWIINRT